VQWYRLGNGDENRVLAAVYLSGVTRYEDLAEVEESLRALSIGVEFFGPTHRATGYQLGFAKVWGKKGWGLALRREGQVTPLLDSDDPKVLAWASRQIDQYIKRLVEHVEGLAERTRLAVVSVEANRPRFEARLRELARLGRQLRVV
jgi:hypothetical protein